MSIRYKRKLIFVLNWFQLCKPAYRIKRESGVNPGQSRCCEARYTVQNLRSH